MLVLLVLGGAVKRLSAGAGASGVGVSESESERGQNIHQREGAGETIHEDRTGVGEEGRGGVRG